MIADSVKVSVFGKISDKLYSAQITSVSGRCKSAYVISHKPVTEYFEGVVVAVAEFDGLDGERPIISQYGEVFYEPELRQVLSKLKNIKLKSIVCLYEKSCGAVIFYKSRQNTKILLVKNSNGRYWSFPKGHIEPGESKIDTAIREVMEETGLKINIYPDFCEFSEYTIQGRIEKAVAIFLAETTQLDYTLQVEEIEECGWFTFEDAMQTLNYENDKRILIKAKRYLLENHI